MMKHQFIWDGESNHGTWGELEIKIGKDYGGWDKEHLFIELERWEKDRQLSSPFGMSFQQAHWLLEEFVPPPPQVTCTLPLKNNLLVKELGELA